MLWIDLRKFLHHIKNLKSNDILQYNEYIKIIDDVKNICGYCKVVLSTIF